MLENVVSLTSIEDQPPQLSPVNAEKPVTSSEGIEFAVTGNFQVLDKLFAQVATLYPSAQNRSEEKTALMTTDKSDDEIPSLEKKERVFTKLKQMLRTASDLEEILLDLDESPQFQSLKEKIVDYLKKVDEVYEHISRKEMFIRIGVSGAFLLVGLVMVVGAKHLQYLTVDQIDNKQLPVEYMELVRVFGEQFANTVMNQFSDIGGILGTTLGAGVFIFEQQRMISKAIHQGLIGPKNNPETHDRYNGEHFNKLLESENGGLETLEERTLPYYMGLAGGFIGIVEILKDLFQQGADIRGIDFPDMVVFLMPLYVLLIFLAYEKYRVAHRERLAKIGIEKSRQEE